MEADAEIIRRRGNDIKRAIGGVAFAAAETIVVLTNHHSVALDWVTLAAIGQSMPPLERMWYGQFPWQGQQPTHQDEK